MRIVIEVEPSELQPSVKAHVTHDGATTVGREAPGVQSATNAGEPPAHLVEALGSQPPPPPAAAAGEDQNAGPAPVWLMAVVEEIATGDSPTA